MIELYNNVLYIFSFLGDFADGILNFLFTEINVAFIGVDLLVIEIIFGGTLFVWLTWQLILKLLPVA